MKKEYLIYKLSDEVKNSCKIPRDTFQKFGVKRGLRNDDGTGVLVGLTNIGNVVGYTRDEEGNVRSCPGRLYYRGYELNDLVEPLLKEGWSFDFESNENYPQSYGSYLSATLVLLNKEVKEEPKKAGRKPKLQE